MGLMGKQSLEMTGKGLLRGPLEDVSRQRVQEVTIDRQTYRHLAKCPSMGWRGALGLLEGKMGQTAQKNLFS